MGDQRGYDPLRLTDGVTSRFVNLLGGRVQGGTLKRQGFPCEIIYFLRKSSRGGTLPHAVQRRNAGRSQSEIPFSAYRTVLGLWAKNRQRTIFTPGMALKAAEMSSMNLRSGKVTVTR